MIAIGIKPLRNLLRQHPSLRTTAFLLTNLGALLRKRQVRVPVGLQEHFLSIMVRVKNEGRFLPEWIAYHAAMGVNHFYIYDNGSTDGTSDILAPFIRDGLVTYTYWPTSPIYPGADLDFFRRYGGSSTWVAFFDPDEFVIETRPGELLTVLQQSKRLPAIAINWRYFGSSNYENLPNGFVTQNFLMADRRLDPHVKVIVQPGSVRRLRNPHNMYYKRGTLARTEAGRRVYSSFAKPISPADGTLRLNHYVYRSREDYRRKATQGFADKKHGHQVPRHLSRIETEFAKHNEVETAPPVEAIEAAKRTLTDSGTEDRA